MRRERAQGRDLLDRFRRDAERARHTPEYELEWLLLDLNEQIHEAMIATGVSRSELAERLGTSRAFITKLLSGQENVTLKTLVRVANALDSRLQLSVVPRAKGKPQPRLPGARPEQTHRAKPVRKAG